MRKRSKTAGSPFVPISDKHRIRHNSGTKRVDSSRNWQSMLLPGPIRHVRNEEEKPRLLPAFVMFGFVLLVTILVSRLFFLQIVNGERYQNLANGNRIREEIDYAPRGDIFDRNGRLLASNTLAFQLVVTPFLLEDEGSGRIEDYSIVSSVSGLTSAEINQAVDSAGEEYTLPVLLLENIPRAKAILIEQVLLRTKGFSLDEVPIRVYETAGGLSHVLGYVGRVSTDDLERDQKGTILPIDFIGKDGIEKQYDDELRGVNGVRRTEVDALGRPLRSLAQQKPETGRDVHLTIDLDLQIRFEEEIRKQMNEAGSTKASGVAVDPDTGEILAMVSLPYYDNNQFSRGISNADYTALISNPDEPLLNKVIAGGYTSGSTVKPMVAAGALQEGIVTPSTIIVDRGSIAVTSIYQPGQSFIFRGWRPGGLGPMDIRSALGWSSNIYFYTVGGGYGNIEGLGVDRLTGYYRQFGLGEKTGIDLPGEAAGRVPDREWKRQTKGEEWYVGDTYNISIGQGDLVVTPLQLTLGNMAVINNGRLLRPWLVKQIGDNSIDSYLLRREITVDDKNFQVVREGMRRVLTDGTTGERLFQSVPFNVAGKSGTAETGSKDTVPHAWFVGFAPYEDPQIVVTALIENGGGGSQRSAPPVAAALEQYFTQ